MKEYRTDDIIYALATGWTKSALALIRASGEGAISLFSTIFSNPRIVSAPTGTVVYGLVGDKAGKPIDEVVATVYRDGHGYTGEESFEITCHGSLVGIKKILSAFSSLGMRQAEGGEFTYRAFLHGKLDLTQAEAVEEMVDSMCDSSQSMALSRLSGSLKHRLQDIRKRFVTVMASIEVQLDYSEDELDTFTYPREKLESIKQELERLADSYRVGKLYGEGAKVVLAGRTNVGKSSLFNYLLQSDRAIVSPIPGTTRDYLEEQCVIGGVPVRLYDTAGLRESGDAIEQEGIDRTKKLIDSADLVVFLHEDGDEVPDDKKVLPVWAKADGVHHDGLSVSAVTGEGVNELLDQIGERLKSDLPQNHQGDVVVASARQHELLMDTASSIDKADVFEKQGLPLDIVAGVLQEGLSSLGEITGEVTTAEMLDAIFSGFCVGK